MSAIKIRTALEIALSSMTPSLITAWENMAFLPPDPSVPFQVVTILFAEPANPSFGDSFHRENGYMQVKLLYPLKVGTAIVMARAEALRALFYRGASFNYSGITVHINRTPEIAPGSNEGDHFGVPVKIRFYSDI